MRTFRANTFREPLGPGWVRTLCYYSGAVLWSPSPAAEIRNAIARAIERRRSA